MDSTEDIREKSEMSRKGCNGSGTGKCFLKPGIVLSISVSNATLYFLVALSDISWINLSIVIVL